MTNSNGARQRKEIGLHVEWIGYLCTNCGEETSELEGAYPSVADAVLVLGWHSYNRKGPSISVSVDGLLCPECQTSSDEVIA